MSPKIRIEPPRNDKDEPMSYSITVQRRNENGAWVNQNNETIMSGRPGDFEVKFGQRIIIESTDDEVREDTKPAETRSSPRTATGQPSPSASAGRNQGSAGDVRPAAGSPSDKQPTPNSEFQPSSTPPGRMVPGQSSPAGGEANKK